MSRFDVVGIGNALVDVIAHASEDFLVEHSLAKGSMSLIDPAQAAELYRAISPAVEMSGGSAANTMVGIASFGGTAAYIGKVDGDDLGAVFAHDMTAVGVRFHTGGPADDIRTGRCIIVVTPDAERTMNTYLGVSSQLCVDDLDEDIIASGEVLYMEGYLFDRDPAKKAFRRAAEIAHANGRLVSLTLSDSFCVDRHRADFAALVGEEVDLLFGNSDELVALYQTETLDQAIDMVRAECEMTAITVGAAGSHVVTAERVVSVGAETVEQVLDTTGAGDLYAAGFLHGLTTGCDLERCARLGSIAAAEVISHVGPRPLVPLSTLVPSP